MTIYDPQHITVVVQGPIQGPGGPTDVTWEVLAHYQQPGTSNPRRLFKITYLVERDARMFAASLMATFQVALLLEIP
jgi:hypothetical protein